MSALLGRVRTVLGALVNGTDGHPRELPLAVDGSGFPLVIAQIGQSRQLSDTNPPVIISTTGETTIVPAVAGVFQDVYSLTITNSSATGTLVTLRSALAGAAVDFFWSPPNSTIMINPCVPYEAAAVNTAWTAQLSVAVTDVRISARTTRM